VPMRYRAALLLPHPATVAGMCLVVLAMTACAKDPVRWGDVSYRNSQLGDPDTRSAVLSANLPAVDSTVSSCLRSIRAVAAGADLFRVWWAARRDSSVVLSTQHSRDSGASWDAPLSVEARDRGRAGCDRPPPGVFFDSLSGYLHLVYFIEGADGAGVFFAHSMDRGAMFHSPVPVVYGNRPSAASVAANGDSVVVVFEDPNASAPRIGIVLSHSTGHIFEARGDVTPDDVPAIRPWIALDHRKISVWWKSGENASGKSADQVGYRNGIWQ
jgi:hypothetical protein